MNKGIRRSRAEPRYLLEAGLPASESVRRRMYRKRNQRPIPRHTMPAMWTLVSYQYPYTRQELTNTSHNNEGHFGVLVMFYLGLSGCLSRSVGVRNRCRASLWLIGHRLRSRRLKSAGPGSFRRWQGERGRQLILRIRVTIIVVRSLSLVFLGIDPRIPTRIYVVGWLSRWFGCSLSRCPSCCYL